MSLRFSSGLKGKLILAILMVSFCWSCRSLHPFGKILKREQLPLGWSFLERGRASFYASRFSGQKTASGELYDEDQLTAAHPTLPFGTIVLVRRVATGRYTLVRINDRGPFHKDRVIDLSRAAATQVGILSAGTGRVELFVVPADHQLISFL